MISSNIVFLAIIHIRNTDIAKMNQLMLDFEITEFEIEYILTFIDAACSNSNQSTRNKYMLESLKEAFTFYSYLLLHNDEGIRQMIESQNDETRASFLKTLVMKVRMSYSVEEEQYSEYETMLASKADELSAKTGAKKKTVDDVQVEEASADIDEVDNDQENIDDTIVEENSEGIEQESIDNQADDSDYEEDSVNNDQENINNIQAEEDSTGIDQENINDIQSEPNDDVLENSQDSEDLIEKD